MRLPLCCAALLLRFAAAKQQQQVLGQQAHERRAHQHANAHSLLAHTKLNQARHALATNARGEKVQVQVEAAEAPGLLPADTTIPHPKSGADYVLGPHLASGNFGNVYKLKGTADRKTKVLKQTVYEGFWGENALEAEDALYKAIGASQPAFAEAKVVLLHSSFTAQATTPDGTKTDKFRFQVGPNAGPMDLEKYTKLYGRPSSPSFTWDRWFKDVGLVATHVSSAIAMLAQNGFVQRDIKPPNVMVDVEDASDIKTGSLKIARIADNGLAKKPDLERPWTFRFFPEKQEWRDRCPGGVGEGGAGSRPYMAPEDLLTYTLCAPLGSSDIWSLGIMLGRLITRPCVDSNTFEGIWAFEPPNEFVTGANMNGMVEGLEAKGPGFFSKRVTAASFPCEALRTKAAEPVIALVDALLRWKPAARLAANVIGNVVSEWDSPLGVDKELAGPEVVVQDVSAFLDDLSEDSISEIDESSQHDLGTSAVAAGPADLLCENYEKWMKSNPSLLDEFCDPAVKEDGSLGKPSMVAAWESFCKTPKAKSDIVAYCALCAAAQKAR